MSTDATLPNYVRPEAIAATPDLTLVADLLAGTRQMHTKSASVPYIVKWPNEEQPVYDFRRVIETCFEGLGRTLSAATGMLFSKEPAITWNASETALAPHYDNIDAAGTKWSVLLKRFAEASLRDGIGAILVDHPSPPKVEVVTGKTEADLGLRPTWAIYARGQVINWRTAVINGHRVLQMVMLHEMAEVEDGVYGIKMVHRYRELRLVITPAGYQATWQLWETDDANASKKEQFRNAGGGVFKNKTGAIADFLPISIAYTGRTDAPMTATIPLMGVAWANLSHWQQSTELRFYRSLSAYPQPVVTGALANDPVTGMPGKLRLGPMVAVHLSEIGASFEWRELSGSSMVQIESGILEKLRQMSMLGMAFLSGDTRQAETAEAKRLDATAENSTLATAAQGIEDAVNSASEHHAWYMGIEKAGAPVIKISRDYESTTMQADMLTAYIKAVADAGLPPRLLLQAMVDGGLLPPDTNIEEIEMEIMANQTAIAESKMQLALEQQQRSMQKIAA